MHIVVSGVHMEVGEALRQHAEVKAEELATHFEKVNDVHITFGHEAHHHHLHSSLITLQANGVSLRGEGQGIDWYAALDEAVAKLSRQLDKYKGRLTKHRERRAKFKEHLKSLGPVAFEEGHVEEAVLDAVPTDMFREFEPEITKKEVTRIAPMSVDEAVMQMDLLHKPAFMFVNAATGEMNMVYREGRTEEGKTAIRWVAPKG